MIKNHGCRDFDILTGRDDSQLTNMRLNGILEVTRAVSNSNALLKKVIDIDAVTVDSMDLDKVSFIKFDVEGSELEAIEGARETILRDRPVMKIACYHRSEDVFTLIRKVLSIRPDYKVYMRHTRCIPGWDTDFYFI